MSSTQVVHPSGTNGAICQGLPINRKDEALDLIMRIYAPDLEKMKSYEVPQAERVKN